MSDTKLNQLTDDERRFRIRAGAFLASVAGVAGVLGFSKTVMTARKEEQKLLANGNIESVRLIDAGSALALRALGWGTFYAFLGTGAICYSIWTFSGAKNFSEFRHKMGTILPRLTKDAPPSSRTEFDGLNDLMEYVSTWKTTDDK